MLDRCHQKRQLMVALCCGNEVLRQCYPTALAAFVSQSVGVKAWHPQEKKCDLIMDQTAAGTL